MTKIIQYWNNAIPADVKKLTETWEKNNPEFEYVLFDHESALSFMKENFSNDIFDAYQALTIPAMVCDVFRVAVISKLGGIYVDCGTQCYESILNLGLDFEKCTFLRKWNGWIWNGFLCASKNDPVIESVWSKISDTLLKRRDGNIWALTGPKVIMDVVNEFTEVKLNYIESEVNTELKSSKINIVEQKKASNIFSIVNNLQHKKTAHWSKLQKIIPTFEEKLDIELPKVLFDKHLIIHIGQHKTGSTSIQQSLVKLKPCDSNVLYPKTGLTFSGHHKISDFLQKDKFTVESLLQKLFDEISESSSEVIILSSEYFSSGNEVDFNKKRMDKIWKILSSVAKKFSTSEVIYYVRPQSKSIESRLNQSIKSRICTTDLSINRFLNNPSLDYSLFDEVLGRYFSSSEIRPRIFHKKSLVRGDIISDFNTFIPNCKLPSVMSNKSIENKDEIMKYLEINGMDITINEKMEKKKEVSVSFRGGEFKGMFELLTEEQKVKIQKFYEKSNLLFFEKYPNLTSF